MKKSTIRNPQSTIHIGIMGGTFNPIHYGHLLAAEEARQRFNLKEFIFVPCARPPHKNQKDIAGPEDRYKMTCLAIESNKYFKASDIELKRGGISYSQDTIIEFKKIYERAQIYFVTGADAIAEIDTWKNAKDLPKLCQFIAVTRPGYLFKIKEEYLKWTHILEIPGVSISSTEIRQRIHEGKSIKYLVPEEVENYIYEHKLYQ
ncbi:MAG: nicotinate-nucleotide adenylyltransferase [bacterium]